MPLFAGVSRLIRKLAALALLTVAVGAPVLLIGWPALSHHQQLTDDVASGLAQLERMRAAIGQERRAGRAVAETPMPDNIFFEADTEPALLSLLQARLVEIAAAQKLQLLSSSQLPLRDDGQVKSIGVRMNFRADMVAVQRLLHAIEGNRPLLFVEVADLRAELAPASALANAAPQIDATLDVFGAAAPTKLGAEIKP